MPPKALRQVSGAACMPVVSNIQEPLRDRNSHKTRLPKAVLYSRLERVGPAQLGIDYDQADGPIDYHRQADEEDGA